MHDYRTWEVKARPQDARYVMEKVLRLFGADAVLMGLEKNLSRGVLESYLTRSERK